MKLLHANALLESFWDIVYLIFFSAQEVFFGFVNVGNFVNFWYCIWCIFVIATALFYFVWLNIFVLVWDLEVCFFVLDFRIERL